MRTLAASDAKTNFGALLDRAQHSPVTIERQGRPVAVVVSMELFQEKLSTTSTAEDRESALRFFESWGERTDGDGQNEPIFENDPRGEALWEKYRAAG